MMPPKKRWTKSSKCNYGNNSQKYLYVEGHSFECDFQEIFSEICTQIFCNKFKVFQIYIKKFKTSKKCILTKRTHAKWCFKLINVSRQPKTNSINGELKSKHI